MITQKELTKLQKLAKLDFSAEEELKFVKKINDVLTMINSLTDVSCRDEEPLRSVCNMIQPFREDFVTSDDISEKLFINVPSSNAGFAKEVKCFIVPKIVE